MAAATRMMLQARESILRLTKANLRGFGSLPCATTIAVKHLGLSAAGSLPSMSSSSGKWITNRGIASSIYSSARLQHGLKYDDDDVRRTTTQQMLLPSHRILFSKVQMLHTEADGTVREQNYELKDDGQNPKEPNLKTAGELEESFNSKLQKTVGVLEESFDSKLLKTVGVLEESFDSKLLKTVGVLEESFNSKLQKTVGVLEESFDSKLQKTAGMLQESFDSKLQKTSGMLQESFDSKLQKTAGMLQESIDSLQNTVGKLQESFDSNMKFENLLANRGSWQAEWVEKLKAYESKFPELFEKPHSQDGMPKKESLYLSPLNMEKEVDFFVDYTGQRSFESPVPKTDPKPDLHDAPNSQVKKVKDVVLCAFHKAKQVLYYGFIYYWRMLLYLNLIVIAHYWARWGSPPLMFLPFIWP